jgi:hypothetical protein
MLSQLNAPASKSCNQLLQPALATSACSSIVNDFNFRPYIEAELLAAEAAKAIAENAANSEVTSLSAEVRRLQGVLSAKEAGTYTRPRLSST